MSELGPFVFLMRPWFTKTMCTWFTWFSGWVTPGTVGLQPTGAAQASDPLQHGASPFKMLNLTVEWRGPPVEEDLSWIQQAT